MEELTLKQLALLFGGNAGGDDDDDNPDPIEWGDSDEGDSNSLTDKLKVVAVGGATGAVG